MNAAHSVFLEKIADYATPDLEAAVAGLLEAAGFRPASGTRVLVKPNLVAPKNMGLSCSEPRLVRAACLYALDRGAAVTVGDSPAFGTGKVIARLSGLEAALADLPVRLVNFTRSRKIRLSFGRTAAVARQALEADVLLNIPRFKVHDQMGMTLCVKNLFGCVVGFRKALAHQLYGERENRFERLILEVMQSLPPVFSLVDGITAMHKSGPAGGEAFALGLVAAGANPVAVDAALYALVGAKPEGVPLWREALRDGLAGADPAGLRYPLRQPGEFDARGFVLPARLDEVAFHPTRFVKGRIKSLLVRLR